MTEQYTDDEVREAAQLGNILKAASTLWAGREVEEMGKAIDKLVWSASRYLEAKKEEQLEKLVRERAKLLNVTLERSEKYHSEMEKLNQIKE